MEQTTSSEHTPEGDEALHIETHGIDEIALKERWA